MLIWSETLSVVPVTIHVALRQVPDLLTQGLVERTARIVEADLRARFGYEKPRLVLSGLNPHAGEAGTMGTEDRDVLAPPSRPCAPRASTSGARCPPTPCSRAGAGDLRRGPLPDPRPSPDPDQDARLRRGRERDAGPAFVRTSPDHGTAFDIAGQGVARPDSLIAALRLARRLAASNVTPFPARA